MTTQYKFFLLPYPFDDFSSTKPRPILCLTNPIISEGHKHVVSAFVTSKVNIELLATDILMNERTHGFLESGLHVSSVIRLHRLITINTSTIKRELGYLDKSLKNILKEKLNKLFES